MNVHLIRKILLVVAVSLLACPFVVAQENFLPGLVVTKSNDTLSGQIDYRNWRNNPARISFRSDATFPPPILRAGDHQGIQGTGGNLT